VVYGRRLAWVAMILVDPEARRQGIATRLMQDVLARLGPVAVVGLEATPQGEPVYAGLGFTDRGGFARMERPAEAVRAEREPAVPRPLTAADLVALAARDRAVFGADRSAVLAWAREQAPEYAWRIGAREEPSGYILGRHGHRTEHLGPPVGQRRGDGGAPADRDPRGGSGPRLHHRHPRPPRVEGAPSRPRLPRAAAVPPDDPGGCAEPGDPGSASLSRVRNSGEDGMACRRGIGSALQGRPFARGRFRPLMEEDHR
jgi:hypothetical protein